jgi:nonsense-mediated mRNA decay protein 3
MPFCPKCGARDKDFYKGFCIDCYAEMNVFAEVPRKLNVVRCKKCGWWFVKGKWVEDSWKTLESAIASKIKTHLFGAKLSFDMRGDWLITDVTGYADPQQQIQVKKEFATRIMYEDRICPSCLKASNKDWEVKIQVRRKKPADIEKYADIVSFIKKAEHMMTQKDERSRSFWSEEPKEGHDFFFGFKTVGNAVYQRILSEFGPEHSTATEFVGITREGKKKVKFTHCVRV